MNEPIHSSPDRRQIIKLGALLTGSLAVPAFTRAESYSLPKLPFAADALEPHIDAMTMEIHHGKHHAAYIAKLNGVLEADSQLAAKSLPELLGALPEVGEDAKRSTLRNNGGGHWNHEFFWQILAPAAKAGKPSAELSKAIESSFGSQDAFRTAFATAATGRFGSGWAWLILKDGKLAITSTANQDNPLMKGVVPDADLGTPILGLDVWEHAYYLKYQNRRPDYIAAWWNVVNWDEVSRRFAAGA